jgi:chlorite dismutase
MSRTDLDIFRLMAAFKAINTKNQTELDAAIAKIEEVKRHLANSETEAQQLTAKRLKSDAHLRALGEKNEAVKEALDKLMIQTPEQQQCYDQISASLEALRSL